MSSSFSFFQDLSDKEITEIKSHSSTKQFKPGELIFAEGDSVDSFYIIDSGRVSIYVEKCGKEEPICILNQGDYFGEMAIFNQDTRTASALAYEDTRLLCVNKELFLSFIESHPELAKKINAILATRNEELHLKESLINATGIHSEKLHVSIKGDPSLRESAFTRNRYESVVDKLLPDLISTMKDLLINRCIYQIFLNFNSGEVRTRSIFDPFNEEIHTANKLVSKAYIDRHFPIINFEDKAAFIKRIYQEVGNDPLFNNQPEHLKKLFTSTYQNWSPVNQSEIESVINQLDDLRGLENFYLRNFGISLTRDAIRMQFNCDGTHFVSSEDYQRFLEENLV